MKNHFKIKLITEGDYSVSAIRCIQTWMQNKFICPAKQSESELIIKIFCKGRHTIFMEIHQGVEIFTSVDHLIQELEEIFGVESYQIDFTEKPDSFFSEFIYSGTRLLSIEDGQKKLTNIIKEMMALITEDEKQLNEYASLKFAHEKIVSDNYSSYEFYDYLYKIVNFTGVLGYMSSALGTYWYGLKNINSDKYTAQEHFKKIVKPVHLKLKLLGFKKKAFKFVQQDTENNIERVIWLQKGLGAMKDELTFVINFCVRPADTDSSYSRSGDLVERRKDSWFMVNISIDTVKTIEILLMHIDKILEVIMDCNSVEEYNEFTKKIRKEAMQARK